MSEHTHWKKLFNPDYIGAWAFEPGEEKVVTIGHVRSEMVIGTDGKKEECTVIHFRERDLKPLIMNATNGKAISKLLGTPYIEQWAGKRIVLGVQSVRAFGETVDAVRVLPKRAPEAVPVIDPIVLCEECGNEIKGFGKRNAAQVAAYTKANYGKCLCADCATKAAEAKTNNAEGENA